jgi:hypothetical protein
MGQEKTFLSVRKRSNKLLASETTILSILVVLLPQKTGIKDKNYLGVRLELEI